MKNPGGVHEHEPVVNGTPPPTEQVQLPDSLAVQKLSGPDISALPLHPSRLAVSEPGLHSTSAASPGQVADAVLEIHVLTLAVATHTDTQEHEQLCPRMFLEHEQPQLSHAPIPRAK